MITGVPDDQLPVKLEGEHTYWELADALEWLRRKGIDAAHYRKEEWHHVFFERWQDHWRGEGTRPERIVASNEDLGIAFVYRCYPVLQPPVGVVDQGTSSRLAERASAGGEMLVRCFKFYHGQRQLGRPRKD